MIIATKGRGMCLVSLTKYKHADIIYPAVKFHTVLLCTFVYIYFCVCMCIDCGNW